MLTEEKGSVPGTAWVCQVTSAAVEKIMHELVDEGEARPVVLI